RMLLDSYSTKLSRIVLAPHHNPVNDMLRSTFKVHQGARTGHFERTAKDPSFWLLPYVRDGCS
ncbi:MAG TPA: hypothetical protein VMT22_16500, partial [Terriglobales bacterium]|nr:hypothetical protein [Terriglobales bacterium]